MSPTLSEGDITISLKNRNFETVQPTAIEQMCTGDWDLTLFTCTVGGRARVAVRCDKVIAEA